MRIVTLLPSATEIVCALGLEDSLVGVSHDCDYPPGVRALPAMTSTNVPHAAPSNEIDSFVRQHMADNAALYELDVPALEAAAPDVVISQALCDVCAVATGDVVHAIESLPSKPALVDLEPNTLDDVLDDCKRVGDLLGCGSLADNLRADLRARRSAVAGRTAGIEEQDRPSVAFLEWLMPPFAGGHWIPELVWLAGGTDLFGKPGEPSFALTWERVAASDPDILFIACCGFTKDRTLADVRAALEQGVCRRMRAAESGRIFVADGNAFFSRPGPRLIDGLEIMAHAIHPRIHPASSIGSCNTVAL